MDNTGWIKLHRKIAQWEWFSDDHALRLFIYILLHANHEDKKWRGIVIKRGELLTGRKALAEKLKISEQSVRTALSRLKSTSEITIKSTNRFSIIQVRNWDKYQTSQPADQPASQPTTNQQLTTTKNYKELKEYKNISTNVDIQQQKKPNPLTLTKSQVGAFAKEFPGLTVEDVKAEITKCNRYMLMSSVDYTNPGLFFRGWLKNVEKEKREQAATNRLMQETLEGAPEITEEQRKKNIQRIASMKRTILKRM